MLEHEILAVFDWELQLLFLHFITLLEFKLKLVNVNLRLFFVDLSQLWVLVVPIVDHSLQELLCLKFDRGSHCEEALGRIDWSLHVGEGNDGFE